MEEFIAYIKSKNKEDLEKELKELYSSYELVRNYYKIKLRKPNTNPNLLLNFKNQITKAIYPDKQMRGGLDFKKVDEIIKQLNSDSTLEYYIEVCLHSIEECSNIAHEYGGDFGDDFYIYFEELFEHILQILQTKELTHNYKMRLEKIIQNAFDGYGHQEQLQETLLEYHI